MFLIPFTRGLALIMISIWSRTVIYERNSIQIFVVYASIKLLDGNKLSRNFITDDRFSKLLDISIFVLLGLLKFSRWKGKFIKLFKKNWLMRQHIFAMQIEFLNGSDSKTEIVDVCRHDMTVVELADKWWTISNKPSRKLRELLSKFSLCNWYFLLNTFVRF